MMLACLGLLGLHPCTKHVHIDILGRQINLVLLVLLLLFQKLHQLQLLWNPPLIRMCLDMHAAQACTLLIGKTQHTYASLTVPGCEGAGSPTAK